VIHLPLSSIPAGGNVVATVPQPKAIKGRNRKVFVVLGLLIGFTGAHNFYAGYWGTAVVQIILSGVTWALGFGIIIPWLWALIELVVVHSDARGNFMK
jgi:TM2 domain-containing membrane protein YozV